MLRPRQKSTYTNLVDVYRKERQVGGEFAWRKSISNLVCRLRATPNKDTAHPFGQQKETNIYVLDHIDTYLIGDGDGAKMDADTKIQVVRCPGFEGLWFSVMGNPQAMAGVGNRVNILSANLNKTTPPRIVT